MADTRRLKRWLLPALGTVLLLLVAADTIAWVLACRRLDDGAADAASAAGWLLQAGPSRWRGWPIAAEVELPDVILRAAPGRPPLIWTAARAQLRLPLLQPRTLIVAPAGDQAIGLENAKPVLFTARRLDIQIDLTAHDPARAIIDGLDATSSAGPLHIDAGTLSFPPDSLILDLSGISVPAEAAAVLPAIDALRATLRLDPPIPTATDPADSARAWQARHGKVQIEDASLKWAELDATGTATITLDTALQPVLAGQIHETGLPAALDTMAQSGTLSRSAALAAKAMLAILAAPANGGRVTLPVAMQDSVVSVAGFPLLRLTPLRW